MLIYEDKFLHLCDQISRQNRNQIRKYFIACLLGAQMARIKNKKGGQKSRDTLPLGDDGIQKI